MAEETELNRQAVEIIEWSRRKLAAKLPEFLPAIYLLPLRPSEAERSLWTDGETLYYHPETVVRDYLGRKDSIAAQIMHITAHGLLGHIPKRQGQNPQLFDAVADAKAAAFVHRLPVPLTPSWKKEIREHVEATGSPRGKEILDNFGEYLQKFKKVLPHDYDKMLRLIAQMEEKGQDSEQAQIEAFYAMKNGK